MLRWTEAGAVPSPTTLQVRVQRRHDARVKAGAPVPTRSLSEAELLANLRHFTVGMRTPRTRPCTGLVLSGQHLADRADLPAAVDQARADGVTHVVLHVGPDDLDRLDPDLWRGRADQLVLPLDPGDRLPLAVQAVARAHAAGLRLSTHTVLSSAALPHLPQVADAIAQAGPARHTFTFPFPTDPATAAAAPDPLAAAAALESLLPRLSSLPVQLAVKGLPACYLGPARPLLARTGNRWYVDADHQLDGALLFFPDVVAFHKGEACRFCSRSDACDGFFAAYLRRPGSRPLEPVPADAAAD